MNDSADGPFVSDSTDSRHRLMIERARNQALAASPDRSASSDPHSPAVGADTMPDEDLVDGYRLLAELHRGGQGLVYRGIQRSTGRIVAVKLLAHGAFATKGERLRFEREVEILSQLTAPGIVRIIDSGVSSGRWWFTMDFIDGEPLDRYVREELADPADRPKVIALCATIADAVNAAHLHGVIHRDLKPRNILVDRDGRPHVLDFGLAKRDAPHVADVTSTMTEAGQFVGSLPWASPEQLGGDATSADMRTDVYALGVILFQLLTDRFPYLTVGPAHEIAATIANVEPARPSSIDATIDRDLDTIILKCLSKDPTRRYQSAGDLARDLRNHLAGEPVEARRDSLAYLTHVWLRRHRLAAAMCALVAVNVVAASILSTVLWRTSVAAEREQERLRLAAQHEVRKAEEVNRFLQDAIAAADPGSTGGKSLTLMAMVESAASRLDAGMLANQPEIEASTRQTISEVMAALGQFDAAAVQCGLALSLRERTLGVDHPDVAKSLIQLSDIRDRQGKRADSQSLGKRALEIMRATHGTQDHEDVVRALQRLAWASVRNGDLTEAMALMDEAIEMLGRIAMPDDVALLQARLDRSILSHGGSTELAASRELLDALRQRLGPRHRDVLAATKMVGAMLQMSGDPAGAERCYREAILTTEEIYGPNHPLVIDSYTTLAQLLASQGDKQGPFAVLDGIRERSLIAYADHRFGHAQFLLNHGGAAMLAGEDAIAESSYEASLALLKSIGASEGSEGARGRIELARLRLRRNDVAGAELLTQETLAMPTDSLAAGHWTRTYAKAVLGQVRLRRGSFQEAESLLLEALQELPRIPTSARRFREESARVMVSLYEAWAAAEPTRDFSTQLSTWRAAVR
jgi:eukaryotic-like serine/threonine-protein kinase